jgi:chaperonin GroES
MEEILTLKPTQSRVLVKPIPVEKKTAGGMLIPEANENVKKPQRGVVIAVGPKTEDIKENQIVLYGEYAGNPVTHEGENYLVMNEIDILLIIE